MNEHANPAQQPPPDHEEWPAYWRNALNGDLMRQYRAALCLRDGMSVRASVIDDLRTYYSCTEDECVERCVHWGRYFDAEWDAAPSVEEFHRGTTSSSFSLLWHAYLEAEGYVWAGTVATVDAVLTAGVHRGDHLDFGAAVGVTSQLFASAGFNTTLADISTTMLAFARYRLERRGMAASYLDLGKSELPVGAFDVISALDVLWLVPDFEATVRTLHDALRPGGVLCANINPGGRRESRWELQNDELALRRQLQRAGFEPITRRPVMVYRKVPRTGALHGVRSARDAVLLGPLRTIYRSARSQVEAVRR